MNKFAVMTSIFSPTKAVEVLSKLDEWQLIVIGDKKSPKDWHYENVIYLSPEDQINISNELVKKLPWNHYSRKIIGYLYAIQQNADIIADVDDDNIPLAHWGELPKTDNHEVIKQGGFINIYEYFSDDFIWPRGFPLDKIKHNTISDTQINNLDVAIWQFLANGDPDVDAIYRLLFNQQITFHQRDPLILSKGVLCPFNSQNTFFLKRAFPLLYLPSTVSFRFTDILRGIIAQPVLWASGLHLGFGSATMFQERNPHNYMKDFESEVPMYLKTEKAANIAKKSVSTNNSIIENLLLVYKNLIAFDIVDDQELEILNAWVQNVKPKMTES